MNRSLRNQVGRLKAEAARQLGADGPASLTVFLNEATANRPVGKRKVYDADGDCWIGVEVRYDPAKGPGPAWETLKAELPPVPTKLILGLDPDLL